jgi:FAD/FMN-containing dehydrogenase
VTGGYLGGGGHSPVTSKYGLGSDQVLSIDIVTPDGRLITADETQNQDLFWAIRGGGPATWGVVVSMTVKVYEKTVFSGMTWDTTTLAMNVTDDQFWEAIEAYWSQYPKFSEAKSYGYCRMSGLPGGGYAWRAKPWMVPGMKLVDFKGLVQPLLDEWAAIGVDPNVEYFEYDNLYDAWIRHFPTERVGSPYARTGSRLIPRENWATPEIANHTIQTVRSVVEDGAFLVHYNINADAPENTPDSAANPAWRDVMMFAIIGLIWDQDTPQDQVDILNDKLTNDLGQRLKDLSPNGGGYLNEGDVMDPEFAQSFYGDHYERLLKIKKKVDPRDLFWAPTAVGSEAWYLTNQNPFVTKQNGRLCRRQ